jgi:flagellin-like hook-associated protein FlgL
MDSNGKVVSQIQNFNGVGGGKDFSLNFAGLGTFTISTDATTNIEDNAAGAAAWVNLLQGKNITFDNTGVTPGMNPAEVGSIDVDINGDKITLYKGDTSAVFRSVGIQLSFNAITDSDFEDLGNSMFERWGAASGGPFKIVVDQISGQNFIVQSGANQGDELNINIDAMNTRKLGISFSDISTQKAASKSITEVNDARNQVSTQRAALGA